MSDPLKTPNIPDAVRVALSYAPLGVADAARHELGELLADPIVAHAARLQAENSELRAFAADAIWTLRAVLNHQPAHTFTPQSLATQFLNQHARTEQRLAPTVRQGAVRHCSEVDETAD